MNLFNLNSLFKSVTPYKTSSNELNEFLRGGFHRDRLYAICGSTASFKTGFAINTLLQADHNSSESFMISRHMTEDEFNDVKKVYYAGNVPEDAHHGFYMLGKDDNFDAEFVENLLQADTDLLLIDDITSIVTADSKKLAVTETTAILNNLAKEYNTPILANFQTIARAAVPERLPSFEESGYEIIHITNRMDARQPHIVLQRVDRKLELYFENDNRYKLF